MEPSPLYTDTPDEEPARADGSWLRTAIGALLVLIGVEILLERLTGAELHLIVPALGLVLLAAWFRHDRFPFLVIGAVLFGWGLGGLVESILGPRFDFASAAGLAWGLWLIPQLSGRHAAPARVASFIVLTIALIQLAGAVGVGGALGGRSGAAAAPLALMAVGLLLVFRRRLTPQVFVVGVIVAAVLGVTAVGGAVGDLDLGFDFGPRRTVPVDLPDLDGRTLAFEGGSGDVTITAGTVSVPSVTASVRHRRGNPVDVTETEDEVVVRAQHGARWSSVAYTAIVPPGTDLRIELGSGDLEARIDGGDVEITTGSGDVAFVIDGDPDVTVTTRSGEIEVAGFDTPHDDEDDPFHHDGDADESVSIDTRSGDVELVRTPLP